MITDGITRHEILLALDELKGMDPAELRKKYRFRTARSYVLMHEGSPYDSKAVVGVAYKYLPGSTGALKPSQFAGGMEIKKLLAKQGFNDVGTVTIASDVGDETPFDATNITDARERTIRTIVQRRGQKKFRDELFEAYKCCAMTGCKVPDVLEAAHIYPYRGKDTNLVTNGLLLRADLHTLFDLGGITIDPKTFIMSVAPNFRDSEYGKLHGQKLHLPKSADKYPNKSALTKHRQESLTSSTKTTPF